MNSNISNLDAFKKKFIKEFLVFIHFLKENYETPEIVNLIKNQAQIKYEKMAAYMYSNMLDDKKQIFNHDKNLFLHPRKYIPTINVSTFFNKMNDDNRNKFWTFIVRLFTYVEIICSKDKETQDIDINTLRTEKIEEETEDGEMGINDILEMFMDGEKINEKIKEINVNDFMPHMESILKMFNKDGDPEITKSFNGVIENLFKKLKNTDFSKQSLSETINEIAKNLAMDLLNNPDKDSTIKISNVIQNFISGIQSGNGTDELFKNLNLGEDEKKIMNIATNYMKNKDFKNGDISNITGDLFKHITSDKEVKKMLQQNGMTQQQINQLSNNPQMLQQLQQQMLNPNRKAKRNMNKKGKK